LAAIYRGTALEVQLRVRSNVMRWYAASLPLVAGLAVVVPVAATPTEAKNPSTDATAVAVQEVRVPDHGLRDEAAMVVVGTALIGIAAAVRRAA
jgi:hypothetical protein